MGSIEGVYATSAKWRGGFEVVSLLYDPEELDYSSLVEKAKQFKCTAKVFTYTEAQLETATELVGDKAVMAEDSQSPRFASDSDQKYYLANSPLRSLPMCDYQITKVNAALGMRQPYASLLSPRQRKLAAEILETVKSDQNALAGYVTPIDANKLGAYAEKLEEALGK